MAKTILVIDDNKRFSLGLTGVLKREGFNVKTAYDGAEGLLAIRTEKPDLILCDVMMPSPNGLRLKKELAKDPLLGAIPFLFLTARADSFKKQAGFDNGADDYITKPFDVNELLARIKSILRRDELGHQRGLLESEESIKKLKQSISLLLKFG